MITFLSSRFEYDMIFFELSQGVLTIRINAECAYGIRWVRNLTYELATRNMLHALFSLPHLLT